MQLFLMPNVVPNVYFGQTKIQLDDSLASSSPEFAGFNLALHVQDEPQRVQQHRMRLLRALMPYGVEQLTWMNQIHSTICKRVDGQVHFQALSGDGLVTSDVGHALMMMTADCLPIVLGNADGTEIANLHAGWKGLAQGIIENTIATMTKGATWAWLGAGISQACFEVGGEVREQFLQRYPQVDVAFSASTKQEGKYYADLYAVARYILQQQGVTQVLGGEECSYTQHQDYYSYRRQARTGRMATFVFIGQSL